jgi:hypothetical protein
MPTLIRSRLAYTAPNAGRVLRDDLNMVIRKQISASGKNLLLKQMGVIGAVATVKNMSKASCLDFDQASLSSHHGGETSSGTKKNPLLQNGKFSLGRKTAVLWRKIRGF